MSCLTAERRTQLEARLARKIKYLTALDTAIDEGVLHIETASLDTGEAKQTMKYRSFAEMDKAMERLESQIDRLCNILNGTGIANLNLKRKNEGVPDVH